MARVNESTSKNFFKKKKKKKNTGKQKPLKGYLRTNDLDTFQVSWTIPGFMDQSYIPTRNDL